MAGGFNFWLVYVMGVGTLLEKENLLCWFFISAIQDGFFLATGIAGGDVFSSEAPRRMGEGFKKPSLSI